MGKPVTIYQDGAEEAIPTIDYQHQMVHEGHHFTASQYISLAAASAVNVLITAPTTDEYHFTAEIAVDAVAVVTWSMTPGYDATGSTAISSYNNNENSSETSALTHRYGGIYASSGALLETWLAGSSSGNTGQRITMGGALGQRHEWILLPSSIHLLRVVAGAATCQTVVRMYYYKD